MPLVRTDKPDSLFAQVDDETYRRMQDIGLVWDPASGIPEDLFEENRVLRLNYWRGDVYLDNDAAETSIKFKHWVAGTKPGACVVQRNGLLLDFTLSNLGSRRDLKAAREAAAALPQRMLSSPYVAWIPQIQAYTTNFFGQDERWKRLNEVPLFSTEQEAEAQHLMWLAERLSRSGKHKHKENVQPEPSQRAFTDPDAPWRELQPPAGHDPSQAIREGQGFSKRTRVRLYHDEAVAVEICTPETIASVRLVQVALLYLAMASKDGRFYVAQEHVGQEMLGIDDETVRNALKVLEGAGAIKVTPQWDEPRWHPDGGFYPKRRPSLCNFLKRQQTGSYGLFPAWLFDDLGFRKLNETDKYVLVTLYMLATGKDQLDFRIQRLIDATGFSKRETVLNALKRLHSRNFIHLTNPCNSKHPYVSHDLTVKLLQ